MFKIDYVCANCKHAEVFHNEIPCTNCVPHSEGFSGFEAAEHQPARTPGDIMDELVRKVVEADKLVSDLASPIPLRAKLLEINTLLVELNRLIK